MSNTAHVPCQDAAYAMSRYSTIAMSRYSTYAMSKYSTCAYSTEQHTCVSMPTASAWMRMADAKVHRTDRSTWHSSVV